MPCPHCGSEKPAAHGRCAACGAPRSDGPVQVAAGLLTPLPPHGSGSTNDASDATFLTNEAGPTSAGARPESPESKDEDFTRLPDVSDSDTGLPGAHDRSKTGPLQPGQGFGARYHIIRLLGIGGMGAVYHAWDAELGVAVALKVIRPEVTADPKAAAELERRFKRELLLARQVTHKNVVRIHDLGEIDAVKYITMPYVQGSDLATVLKQAGKLPAPKALAIAREIASGLLAAHEAGVVHRDLKPANIMIEADGHALIMDFGIARSTSRSGTPAPPTAAGSGVRPSSDAAARAMANEAETLVGAVIGTLEYMAPEQAKGESVDHRADIYAFGLIFYDMLLGGRQARGAVTALDELTRRMQQAPPAPRSVDPAIPEALDRMISKCLSPDPAGRYETTAELVAEFDRLDDQGEPLPIPWRLTRRRLTAAISLVLTLLVGTWWLARGPAPLVEHAPVSVLIADFENRAKNPAFEESLEQALGIAIEGASFINTYKRDDARKLGQQLKPGSRLDEGVARLVSMREGITVVLAGAIEPRGGGYGVSVKAVDPANGNVLGTASASARGKEEVLKAVGSIASEVRGILGDTTPESAKLAAVETVTAASLEAVRDYSRAQDLLYSSKDEEAIAYYKRAIARDPNFGRAYSGWAISAGNLGRQEEAAEAWKKALSLLDRMTEREKYRTLGMYFTLMAHNYEKAIENFSTLVKLYPNDRAGHVNLALAYFYTRNFAKALEEGRRSIEAGSKDFMNRTNYALYAMYAGDFKTAAVEARNVIDRDPSLYRGYLPLAVAALAGSDLAAARSAYERMAKSGTPGASLAALGLADLALYEGRFADADAILRSGIEHDLKTGNTGGMAAKQTALAEVYLEQRRMRPATVAAARAIEMLRRTHLTVPAGRVMLLAGNQAAAKELAEHLNNQVQPESRAHAKVLEGEIALHQRRTVEAIEAFRAALKLVDLWWARFGLGVAYIQAGHHPEALAELELCQKRRGEATAIFLDDLPSFRYLATLPYWLARAQEGVGQSAAAAANYKVYLALRAGAPRDPLAVDARQRLGPLS